MATPRKPLIYINKNKKVDQSEYMPTLRGSILIQTPLLNMGQIREPNDPYLNNYYSSFYMQPLANTVTHSTSSGDHVVQNKYIMNSIGCAAYHYALIPSYSPYQYVCMRYRLLSNKYFQSLYQPYNVEKPPFNICNADNWAGDQPFGRQRCVMVVGRQNDTTLRMITRADYGNAHDIYFAETPRDDDPAWIKDSNFINAIPTARICQGDYYTGGSNPTNVPSVDWMIAKITAVDVMQDQPEGELFVIFTPSPLYPGTHIDVNLSNNDIFNLIKMTKTYNLAVCPYERIVNYQIS